MGFDSIWHWLILLVVVLVIFGTGKLSKIGPDLGNAVRGFKKAMRDGDEQADKGTTHEQLRADPPAAEATAQERRDAEKTK